MTEQTEIAEQVERTEELDPDLPSADPPAEPAPAPDDDDGEVDEAPA